MTGLVKIGFTDRDPITRSKELSSHTCVQGKFNIEKSWEVQRSLIEKMTNAYIDMAKKISSSGFRVFIWFVRTIRWKTMS
jgi:hypothetical protein